MTMLIASSAEGGEFVEEFAEEAFCDAGLAAAAAVVGGEVAAGDASGVGGVRRGGFFDVLGQRRKQPDNVAEAFLLVGLGHADDGAESVGAGIIAGVSGDGGEDYGNVAEAWSGFDVAAEVITGVGFAFDFGDEQGRREEIENFASIGGAADGDDVVTLVLEEHFQGFAELGVGVHGEDHGFFGADDFRRGGGGLSLLASVCRGEIFRGRCRKSNGDAAESVAELGDAYDAARLLGVDSFGRFAEGEYDGDLHAAGITIELGMEQDARARNVEGGGDFLGAAGFGLDGADANGRRDQGAAFYTAVLRALVSGRSRGRRSVMALFGDKLLGYRIHFRDNLFVGDFGGARFFAARERRRIF